MEERRYRVQVVYVARRNQFVLRWKNAQGQAKERRSHATDRYVADREAYELERELHEALPTTDWADFCARYEREHLNGKPDYNWRAMCKRLESVSDISTLDDVTGSLISKAMASMQDGGNAKATIRGHVSHFMASLSWAKEIGLIKEVPSVRMPKRRSGKKMRSRPITGEEFDRLLLSVPKVKQNPEPWTHLLNVMYWGGLRIGEAAILTADWSGEFAILMDHDPVVFSISSQKNEKSQLLPAAPELVDYIRAHDFPKRGRLLAGLPLRVDSMVTAVRKIGARSGIVVNKDGKTVTAHDLRRSFGTRWAQRDLKPAELKEIMRHADIRTTMEYYVDIEVSELSAKLRQCAIKLNGADKWRDSLPDNQIAKKQGK